MPTTPNQIQDLLDRDPFQSFRIVTNQGKAYEVKKTTFVHVFRSEIFYVFPRNDTFALIALRNIASVEVDATEAG